MFEKVKYWWNSLFRSSKVISVRANFNEGTKSTKSYIVLENVQGDVLQKEEVGDFDELEKLKVKNVPIVLSITGGPVLTKSVLTEKGTDLAKAAFPQINQSDFVIQKQEIGAKTWVSLLRKDQLESLIQELNIAEKNIVSVQLGIQSFLPFITSKSRISGFKLNFENEVLVDISKDDKLIDEYSFFDGNKLASSMHYQFMAGTRFLLGIQEPVSELNNLLNQRSSSIIEERLIKILGISTICIAFGMALINFIWFNRVNESWNELSSQKLQMESEMRAFNKNLEAQQKQSELFSKLNIKKFTRHAEIVDKLAPLANRKIQLTSFALDPLIESKRVGAPVAFEKDIVMITGEAINGVAFEEFTKDLEKNNIIKDVFISEYAKNEQTRRYYFSLKLEVNEI